MFTPPEHRVSPLLKAKTPNRLVFNQEKLVRTSDDTDIDIGDFIEAPCEVCFDQLIKQLSSRGCQKCPRPLPSERESAYVVDGLMRNDVIKSDVHSTDTHG